MSSLYEHAGGDAALHRLEQLFYDSVLTDPLLQPLFGGGQPQHVDHLTAFTAETFGGPDRFSRELGFSHLIDVHRGLKITDDQRRRFVSVRGCSRECEDEPQLADVGGRDLVERRKPRSAAIAAPMLPGGSRKRDTGA